MDTSTVTRKGQVTIPVRIRERLVLKEGDKVAFVEEDDKIVLRPVLRDIGMAFGLVKARKTVSLDDMDRAIRTRAGR